MGTTVKTIALVCLLSLTTGCAMTQGEQRVLTGTAIGAGAGALIGGSTTSTLIGAGVGAAGGYLYHKGKQ